jgi:hypothetical protein
MESRARVSPNGPSCTENADSNSIGKSVMCSYLVEAVRKVPALTVCYYFCNSKDPNDVCGQILRTIVLQLLRSHLDLASLIANQYVYQGHSCGMPRLRELIPQLLQTVPHTRIIIDGIDECPNESQAILKEVDNLCADPETHCKVLLSSRKEADIREKLSGKPQVSLDGRNEVEMDIRLYLKYKIRQLRTSDEALLHKIESILAEKANGEKL